MGDILGKQEMFRAQDVSNGQFSTMGIEGSGKGVQEASVLSDSARIFNETWKGKTKVLISEPSIGTIDYQAHESMCDIIAALKEYELVSNYKFFKTCLGRLMVSYAREKFSEYAVDMGFDYIMFLDDDHIWPLNLFHGLEKYLKDYDIVAPLCLQRAHPFYPVIYKNTVKKLPNGMDLYDNEKYVNLKEIKKGDIITDADAIGFGAVIIKVDLLRKIKKPWFFNQAGVGEDIWFSMRAKHEAEAKIVVDTNIECPHLKDREPVFWKDHEESMYYLKIGEKGRIDHSSREEKTKKELMEKYGKECIVNNAKPEQAIEAGGIENTEGKYCTPL